MGIIISILTLIIAIMSFSSKRVLFLVRILLSCVTCYWILKLKYHTIEFWNGSDYTWENLTLFIDSGLACQCFFYTALSFLFFYVILYFVIEIILNITLKRKFDNFFNQLSEFERKKFLRLLNMKFIPKFLKKSGESIFKIDIDEATNFRNSTTNAFTLFIHSALVWYIISFSNSTYMLIVFIPLFIGFVISLLIAPVVKSLSEAIYKSEKINV